MKKIKIGSILLLIVSTVLFVVFKLYSGMVTDNTPPVVTCKNNQITVSVNVTEEELLQGVTAQDDKSGDVSDTLVVEKISTFLEDGKRVVTYAAVDDSMNVGRCEQTIYYSDYEAPRFDVNRALSFPLGSNVDILGAVSAKSEFDGDLTDKIKYSIPDTINTIVEGNYPIEFRVMDSAGNTVYLETQIQITSPEESRIGIELDKYLVYVKKGKKFSAEKYYKDADVEGISLRIKSNVDTDKVGVYHVDYTADSNGIRGKSRLIVVVE